MKLESKLIGITSGCGGVGTSSLALVLGRSLSRLFEKRVLLLSFDLLSVKNFASGGKDRLEFYGLYQSLVNNSDNQDEIAIEDYIVSDEYGLNYIKSESGINVFFTGFNDIELLLEKFSSVYDVIILDIPSCQLKGLTLLPNCDAVIMNYGIAKQHQYIYCDEYLSFIRTFCPDSSIEKFTSSEDHVGFMDGEADIHGEFGSEVRRLAQKLGF